MSEPKHPPPLQITPIPTEVWETINIDYLGPLRNGFYVVVAIDQLSKFPEVDIVKTTLADALITFLQRIVSTYGIPYTIITDNGPLFNPFNSKNSSQNSTYATSVSHHDGHRLMPN